MKLKNNKKSKIHHEMLFLEEQVYTGIFFEFTGRLDWLSWSNSNRLVPGAKTIKKTDFKWFTSNIEKSETV